MDNNPSSKFNAMWKWSKVTKINGYFLVEAVFPQETTISCVFIYAEMRYILARCYMMISVQAFQQEFTWF